ncbi:hypothetical protein FisN_14Lh227 [Fistulifera solaris]|uniref:Uncharacterized protein n=1 Tax=Fistulifera solaris TaxID=1519565 RepID=A0A1Z5JAC5_FISSO|nr:hypothetical protein FisN_14Lh227 [Fistulifera solaris]|eukprot:GAX10711.1 hypothetical protein FisN_14Lh227 [Fistulifera solaris]
MSYEIPESSKPILDSELPPDLQKKFYELCVSADRLNTTHEILEQLESSVTFFHQDFEEEFHSPFKEKFSSHFEEEVSSHSLLARTVTNDSCKISLLKVIATSSGHLCRRTFDFLLHINPHALLYPGSRSWNCLIHDIAADGMKCSLLPGIAEHYPWVFQHALCQQRPPHIKMMKCYLKGQCSLETVRTFYEWYPQGLQEKNSPPHESVYPLSLYCDGSAYPDADFFIWMAKQFPEAVYDELNLGRTMMQQICFSLLSTIWTPDLVKIFRFLITEHASLACESGSYGWPLPIHALAISSNRPLMQEMAVLMLKRCPDCVKDSSGNWLEELSAVAFLQQVHPLILRELEIDEEIDVFTQISINFSKAATLTSHQSTNATGNIGVKSTLFNAISVVYCSWSNLRANGDLPKQKQQIQEQISEVCRRFEGEDDPQMVWELEQIADELELLGLMAHSDYESERDDDGNYNDLFLREDRASGNEESEIDSFGSERDEAEGRRCCWPFHRNRVRGR